MGVVVTGFFRGHPIIWEGEYKPDGRWVYADTKEPLPGWGGHTRPCFKCNKETTLGEGEVDPCLGVLPGVDNACCGHGRRSEAYVRFNNGLVLREFIIGDNDSGE